MFKKDTQLQRSFQTAFNVSSNFANRQKKTFVSNHFDFRSLGWVIINNYYQQQRNI